MVEFNRVFHVTSDCPVEDICDALREMDEIEATWTENEDDTITVTIQGYAFGDELTNDYSIDQIQEQIDKLKEFPIMVPDQFLAVILGGYSSEY